MGEIYLWIWLPYSKESLRRGLNRLWEAEVVYSFTKSVRHVNSRVPELRAPWTRCLKTQGRQISSLERGEGYKVPLLAQEPLAVSWRRWNQSSLRTWPLEGAHLTSVHGHTSKSIRAAQIGLDGFKQKKKRGHKFGWLEEGWIWKELGWGWKQSNYNVWNSQRTNFKKEHL